MNSAVLQKPIQIHDAAKERLGPDFVTGSAGFIAGYLVRELLDAGYRVRGVDNFSKYGRVEREYDGHPAYELVVGDCKDAVLMRELVEDCEQVIAGAALIGGISYFHNFAYDLLAENGAHS